MSGTDVSHTPFQPIWSRFVFTKDRTEFVLLGMPIHRCSQQPEGDWCLYCGQWCDINSIRRASDEEFEQFKLQIVEEERRHTEAQYAPQATQARPGYVYVVESNGFVKIGSAQNVKKRLSSLNTGNPYTVGLLKAWHCEDAPSVEAQLHKTYGQFRARGEWFKLSSIQVKKLIQSSFS